MKAVEYTPAQTAEMLSALKKAYHYNPTTGVFTRLLSGQGKRAGEVVGSIKSRGYIHIGFCGRKHHAARLAWLYMNGRFPSVYVDHINGNPSDNRINNLREANNSENMRNKDKMSRNSSGYKGVTYHRKSHKWQAQIQRDGKSYYIGLFDTAELAHDAYHRTAIRVHGEFANIGSVSA